MSLFKQKGSVNWWIKIYTAEGAARRVSSGTPDKEKAKAVEGALLMARGGRTNADTLHQLIDELCGNVRVKQMALQSALDTYVAYITATRKIIAPRTMENRAMAFRRFLKWSAVHYTAASSPGKVDRACALGFAQQLIRDKLRDKSRKNMLSDLSTIWEALMRCSDEVTLNPWKLVKPEVLDSEPGKPFSDAQADAVLKAADDIGHGWGLACRIALYTGLRFGDVAKLEWDDIDFEKAVIALTPGKTARHNVRVLLPVAPKLMEHLKPVRMEFGFVLPKIGHRYPRQLKDWPFAKVLETAELDPETYTFHSWRHTFRTRLGDAGVSSEIAKKLGGWTNDKMAGHYDHSTRIEELRAAVSKI